MKTTGIVRGVDDLGRIVIPKEIRRMFGVDAGDSMEIYMDSDSIILKKYEPDCIFCGSADGITEFKGKKICRICAQATRRG